MAVAFCTGWALGRIDTERNSQFKFKGVAGLNQFFAFCQYLCLFFPLDAFPRFALFYTQLPYSVVNVWIFAQD